MLKLIIPGTENWDERTETFITDEPMVLELEHSLYALSRWESKWHKSFLSTKQLTEDEFMDYIQSMIINDPFIEVSTLRQRLTRSNYDDIHSYIENPMSATKIYNDDTKSGKDTITAELIYYWMSTLQIPFSCEHWHLNRLFKLVEVASIKNNPPKKMSKKEILARNANLNEKRKQQYNTKG